MKFQRKPRYGSYRMTARKAELARTREQRAHEREKARLPLLAEQLAPPAPARFDAQAEQLQREVRHREIEQRMRGFEARVWRESRRDARAASPEVQAAIRAAWQAWGGPATALYYRWMVDVHTGVAEQRLQAMKAKEQQIRAEVFRQVRAQGALDFATDSTAAR